MKYKTIPVVHLEGLHKSDVHQDAPVITIYAPMIYTAPCTMFWMSAYPLRGQVGGEP
jgi:hypothetical protein